MFLADLVKTSSLVTQTSSRLKKIEHLTDCLRRLARHEIEIGVAYLSGDLRQGRIGIGPSVLSAAMSASSAESPGLTLTQVDEAFERIAGTTGTGSAAERTRLLAGLLARATHDEQQFLARLVLGELRQGALEGVMVEAIARASAVPAREIRTAAMVAGDLIAVARAALGEGPSGLERFSIEVLRPVQPMLAQSADNVDDAMEHLSTAALEYKMDVESK